MSKNEIGRIIVARRQELFRKALEQLEDRRLMCVDHQTDSLGNLLGTFAAGNVPDEITVLPTDFGGPQASGVPALNSRPSATRKLFLDFDGAESMTWAGKTTGITPRFDMDGNTSSFNSTELDTITAIFNRVAEKFSPFDLNITTEDPGSYGDGQTLRAVIGGNGSWYGNAGGVAYVGGFYNTASNVVWVFSDVLSDNAKYVAEAVAHESGHGFGLWHQSAWNGTTKTAEYFSGTADKAPILGSSYSSARGLWWSGFANVNGAKTAQADMSILANSTNGFGYRTDDFGNTIATAATLNLDGPNIDDAGTIEQTTDVDYFAFTTLAGTITVNVSPFSPGGMLDATLRIVDSAGNTIATHNPTTSLSATLTVDLGAGTYYAIVGSAGSYGDVGQYTLSGNIVTSPDYVAKPASVAATSTNGAATVTWSDRSGNETGFVIQRSADGGSTWSDAGSVGAGVVTFTDSTVEGGTGYQYRVYATGSAQNSGYSNVASVNVRVATPSGLTFAAIAANAITLQWSNLSGETNFKVDRSTNGTTWTQIGLNVANDTDLDVTGLSAGTRYYFRVRAGSVFGDTSPSTSINTLTLPAAPVLTLTATSTTAIRASWADVASETSYVLERSDDGNSWTQIATPAANALSYTDTGHPTGTVFSYRVRAVNPVGVGAFSTVKTSATLLNAPTGLGATPVSASRIDLSWSAVDGATGYRLQRLSGTTWVNVVDVTTNAASLTTGLSAGTTYTFRVLSQNLGGYSAASATAATRTLPAQVAAPALSPVSDTSMRVTWTAVTGATGYLVERSPDGSVWTTLTTATTATTYTDSGLTTDTVYHYRVRANGTTGNGAFSATANRRTILPAVSAFTATPSSTSAVQLSWDDASTETGYRIERLSGTTWTLVATVAAGTTNREVTGLSAGTSYQFRIMAVNEGGNGVATTATARTLPARAANPTLASVSDTSIRVTWATVTGNTGYHVQRSVNGVDWTLVNTAAANATTFTDTGLTANSAYQYRVRAFNASGNGEFSNAVSRATLLSAVSSFTATADSASQITLSWSNVTGESGYRLERLSGTTWTLVATLAADTTTRTVTGLSAGTSYQFRLMATSAVGNGVAASRTIATRPAAPTGLSLTAITGGLKLSWANVAGESGYVVQRSSNGADWSDLATVAANVVTYSNTGLTAGTYYYRVIATASVGNSNASAAVNRTIA
jgi:fibronectin type 3 domain-containing protein